MVEASTTRRGEGLPLPAEGWKVNIRAFMLALAGLAVVLSLLSVLLLPWAWYGNIAIPLHDLPNWGAHLGIVLAFYAALVWSLLAPAGRRTWPLIGVVCAGAAALATTVFVTLGYDNSSALFPGVVPMVNPRLGSAPFVAALAILLGLGATAASSRDPKEAGRPHLQGHGKRG